MSQSCIGLAAGIALSLLLTGSAFATNAAATPLAAHRAVYDLKLGETRGSSAIEAIRGRIVYDFSGNACEGYALKFRQVTEIATESGANVSDLRSTTFEDDAGKTFRFNSQNFLNQQPDTAIDGLAERQDSGTVGVALSKPVEKKLDLPEGVIFPTAQIKAIVGVALEGRSVFESRIYDGSDGGEKVYSTLAVIGKAVDPSKPREGAAADRKELDGMRRWPVTISYFDPSKQTTGEQTPVYSISFELYENGISGSVKLDYGDFTLDGSMSSLDLLPQAPCP